MKLLLCLSAVSILLLLGCQDILLNTGESNNRQVFVTMARHQINPSAVVIEPGTTVTWVNSDGITHALESRLFTSPEIRGNANWSFVFRREGSYNVHSSILPTMEGLVIVRHSDGRINFTDTKPISGSQ